MLTFLEANAFNPVWEKLVSYQSVASKKGTFEAFKIMETSDGGICMATYQNVPSSALLKMKADGTTEWFRVIPDQFLPKENFYFLASPFYSALSENSTHIVLRQSFAPFVGLNIFRLGYFSVLKTGVNGIGLTSTDTINKTLFSLPSDVLADENNKALLVSRANGNGDGFFIPAVNVIRDNSRIEEFVPCDTSRIFQDGICVVSACKLTQNKIAYLIGTPYQVGINQTDLQISILNSDFSSNNTFVFKQSELGLNNNLFYPSQLLFDGEDFIVAGYTAPKMNQSAYQCLIKIGQDGTIKNRKQFSEPIVLKRFIVNKEKSIVGAGFYRLNNRSQFCYTEISSDFLGYKVHNWGDTSKYSNTLNDIAMCKDGGYYVAGASYSTDSFSDAYVARLNPTVLSVESEKEESSVQVVPNPASSEVIISLSQQLLGEVEVQIFNSLGETVTEKRKSLTDSELVFDIGNLPNGAYNIVVSKSQTSIKLVKKFIVVR